MATTTPIGNTPRAEAPQLSKATSAVEKKPSGTVDTLEVAKSDAKSSTSKSKSWFSSCLEKIWNFFKCIFCCSKKDSSKEGSSATATATNAASITKVVKDRSKAESYTGLTRELYALEWMKEAKEAKDEDEMIKAAVYLGWQKSFLYKNLPEAEQKQRIKEDVSKVTIPDLIYQIHEHKIMQIFVDRILPEKWDDPESITVKENASKEKALEAWNALDAKQKTAFVEKVIPHVSTPLMKRGVEEEEAIGAFTNVYGWLSKHSASDEGKSNVKKHILSPLIARACHRIAVLGILESGRFGISRS